MDFVTCGGSCYQSLQIPRNDCVLLQVKGEKKDTLINIKMKKTSKWIKSLYVRPRNIKLLEENIEGRFVTLVLTMDKAWTNKENQSTQYFIFFLSFSRTTPMAYGGSQARGLIKAVAAGLLLSPRNAGSEPCLWPTPQLMAISDI